MREERGEFKRRKGRGEMVERREGGERSGVWGQCPQGAEALGAGAALQGAEGFEGRYLHIGDALCGVSPSFLC